MLKKAFLSIVISLSVLLMVLEIIFRFLPVSDRLEPLPVNDANPIYHYAYDKTSNITIGRSFEIRSVKRTNNCGFYSDIDFVRDTACRKIVFIGDSFVEALQVDNNKTVHQRLNELLPPGHCVYGIGCSGAALSQYQAYANYAVKAFDPEALVFLIFRNDFDQAVLGYDDRPGHHYYDSSFNLVRKDYVPSHFRDFLYHSALFRYLYINLKVLAPTRRSSRDMIPENVQAQKEFDARVGLSMQVTDHFLQNIKDIAGERKVYILIDGLRPAIYRGSQVSIKPKSFVGLMYDYMEKHAKEQGFRVVNLDRAFRTHFSINRKKFDFPTDAHWNELGHEVAAQELAKVMIGNE
jgi:hypothetical protein